jgi:hemerythrin superfamily protein
MRTGGALMAGAAMGFLAGLALTPARKAAVQGMEMLEGDWYEVLKAEHQAVEALFELVLATDERQTTRRQMLLTKIAYSLNKHAIQEENVVYPALRKIDEEAAKHLISDHGEIKTMLNDLQYVIEKDDPRWLETMRKLSMEVISHAREEEDEIFPRLRGQSQEENDAITRRMHWEGMKVA